MLGGDTCPREGFVPAQVDDILGLPEQGYSAVVMCTAGYRAKNDKHADMAKIRDKTSNSHFEFLAFGLSGSASP